MQLVPARIAREAQDGGPSEGLFLLGDARKRLKELTAEYAGQVQLIYMDPPYMTGDRYVMRVRQGEEDWKSGKGSLELPAFDDTMHREEYLAMMREILVLSKELLRPEGMLFLHVDFRAQPYLRLMLDEIFGEENFLNEIIWAYQTGGRSRRYFSRKHDVILFYRKSAAYKFDIDAVRELPMQPKSNHMRRHVDPDGRVYRSISANGRTYTYYDDDPVAPGDVWDDVSHLQQKDPERTGYDTQKPLALLNRILKCASQEGDLVLDPFAGSSTTLESAKRVNRRFIGVDLCPLTLNIARRRLEGAKVTYDVPPCLQIPACSACIQPGVGFYHVTLNSFGDEPGWERQIDGWAVGYIVGDSFRVLERFTRSKKEPALQKTLRLPVFSGNPAVLVYKIDGYCYGYFADTPL